MVHIRRVGGAHGRRRSSCRFGAPPLAQLSTGPRTRGGMASKSEPPPSGAGTPGSAADRASRWPERGPADLAPRSFSSRTETKRHWRRTEFCSKLALSEPGGRAVIKAKHNKSLGYSQLAPKIAKKHAIFEGIKAKKANLSGFNHLDRRNGFCSYFRSFFEMLALHPIAAGVWL